MTKTIPSAVGALMMLFGNAWAGEPTHDLEPKEAVRLISLKSDVPSNAVSISFIVDGCAKCGNNFEVKSVRRVAAIHIVREGNLRVRRLVFYDLFWNESLGWFMWESRPERGGDAVYIWSELKGQIVNR